MEGRRRRPAARLESGASALRLGFESPAFLAAVWSVFAGWPAAWLEPRWALTGPWFDSTSLRVLEE